MINITSEGNLEASTDEARAAVIAMAGLDPKTPPPVTAVIDGQSIGVGASVVLRSGAKVTLNGDGTLTYDPAGRFSYLSSPAVVAARGSGESAALDSFAYRLGAADAVTVDVTVTGVDDAPLLDLNGDDVGPPPAAVFEEGEGPVRVSPEATLVDPDSPHFGGGTLEVAVSLNAAPGDRLTILDGGGAAGTISVEGDSISFGSVVIGTVTGGADGAPLIVTFTADATPEAVQALVRNVAYENASDDPSTSLRTVSFTLDDGYGGSAEAEATVAVVSDDILELDLVADGSDQSAIINAALAGSNSSIIKLPPGEFWIGAGLVIPDGKTLIGSGLGQTELKVLASFEGQFAITLWDDSVLSDLSLDAMKVNLGLGAGLRIHGVSGRGDNFLVEDVAVKNTTGYAFYGVGLPPDRTPGATAPTDYASGVFRNCVAENGNVLFETMHSDGVLFENVHGSDGDGDIPCEAAFHPSYDSYNITYKDSSYIGGSTSVYALAIDVEQKNIVFDNVYGETQRDHIAVVIDGPTEVFILNSTFKSLTGNAVNIYSGNLYAESSRLEGAIIAVATGSGIVELKDTDLAAIERSGSNSFVWGIYLDPGGSVTMEAGSILVSGEQGGDIVRGSGATISDRTALRVGEWTSVSETGSRIIDVLSNDHIPEGPILAVAAIDGLPVSPGQTVTIASGAKVTYTGGTLVYDPNGRFSSLISDSTAAATGAVNTSAADYFTYSLNAGGTLTVAVKVQGESGAGDRLAGNAADNLVTGSSTDDVMVLDQGGDDAVFGGEGNDVILFGGAMTSADSADGGAGRDQLVLQGDYSGGLTFGAGVLDIENLALLAGDDRRFGDPGTSLYDYDITLLDSNVAPGVQMVIDANRLRAGEDFTFDGSAEQDGSFFIYGAGGTDRLTGGAGNDVFLFGAQGQWGSGDVIDGGPGGYDQLALRGDYSVAFGAGQLVGIEHIGIVSAFDTRFGVLGDTYDYDLTMDDGNVDGIQMTVDAAALRPNETLTFDGSAEDDGSFRVFGGRGNDVIAGSRNADLLVGREGSDILVGNGGNDVFRYNAAEESTSEARDRIDDFTSGDLIDLSRIDADILLDGNQAFTFIGDLAFQGTAGELRLQNLSENSWLVQGDTNGDRMSDFELILIVAAPDPITAADFLL